MAAQVLSFMEQLTNSRRMPSGASLLKFTSLHPQVQKHLTRVYTTLCACLTLCALGCWVGLQLPSLLWLTQIAAFGCVLGLAFTPDRPQNLTKRHAFLAGFSFCQGCALTPLVAFASAVYPGLVLTAMLCSAAVFLCFSGAALLTPRRTYLFLGGYLSAALLGMAALRLSSWLLGTSRMGLDAELYLGLLVFSGYILFDTQVIIEQAYAGDMDHVRHAQNLLVNVLGMFVRVLVLLLRNAEKREQEKAKREGRKQRQH